MKRFLLLLVVGLWLSPLSADDDNVLAWVSPKGMDVTYKVVYNHLESNRFFVVFEPNIQKNVARFAERWGDDYNRNKLSGIRAMVFCNAWYTNRVSNADPDMLALCPLHITLVERLGETRILFVRPTEVAEDSKALAVVKELEQEVSMAIEAAVSELRGCPATC